MNLEITGVFIAGSLTLVTPCVLPMVPIYLALLAGGEAGGRSRWRLALSTALFSAGLLAVFVAMGLTATALGGLLAEHRIELTLLGGLVIFLFGLKFLGVLRVNWLDRERRLDDSRWKSRFRLLNALLMGVVFGLGWTPCVGPILGSVLTFTASQTTDPAQGALYLAVYGLGLVTPLIALSFFADAARRLVRRAGPWLPRLERASGLLLLGVGLYLMFSATAVPTADRGAPSPAGGVAQRAAPTAIVPPLGQPTDRPRMVEFTSSSCSICRQMIATVALVKQDCHGRDVDVVEVDVDRHRDLAAHYRVRGVPTFVFLDRQGHETARLVGYQTLAALRQGLAALVGERCAGLGLVPPPADHRPAQPTCGGSAKRGERPTSSRQASPGEGHALAADDPPLRKGQRCGG